MTELTNRRGESASETEGLHHLLVDESDEYKVEFVIIDPFLSFFFCISFFCLIFLPFYPQPRDPYTPKAVKSLSTVTQYFSSKRHSSDHGSEMKSKEKKNANSTGQSSTRERRMISRINGTDPSNLKKSGMKSGPKSIKFFCCDLSQLPDWFVWIFLFCCVMIGFLAIGTVEEGFKVKFSDFTMGWFMTAIELYIFSIFVSLERMTKCECADCTPTLSDFCPACWVPYLVSGSANATSSSVSVNNATQSERESLMMSSSNGNVVGSGGSVSSNGSSNVGNSSTIVVNIGGGVSQGLRPQSIAEEPSILTSSVSGSAGVSTGPSSSSTSIELTARKESSSVVSLSAAADSKISNNNKSSFQRRAESSFSRLIERKVELRHHFYVALFMTLARGLTNISMLWLNYPTQVVFKSMKLITVMIGAKYVLGKTYSWWDYCSSPILVCSAILFSLGDTKESLKFNLVGTTSVLVSLVFDSCHATYQEWILKQENQGDTIKELLVYSNLFAAILSTIAGLISMEAAPLIAFFSIHSFNEVMSWFVIRVVCLYLGVSAYLTFMKKFGSVAATTITTVRKILTVILSYLLWPDAKVFARQHALGSILFFVSLGLNVWGVRIKERKKRQSENAK